MGNSELQYKCIFSCYRMRGLLSSGNVKVWGLQQVSLHSLDSLVVCMAVCHLEGIYTGSPSSTICVGLCNVRAARVTRKLFKQKLHEIVQIDLEATRDTKVITQGFRWEIFIEKSLLFFSSNPIHFFSFKPYNFAITQIRSCWFLNYVTRAAVTLQRSTQIVDNRCPTIK